MTITNTTLISLISKYGEATVAAKLVAKLEHDEKQKRYHATYNKVRNALTREVKARASAAGMSVDDYLDHVREIEESAA